MVVIHVVSCCCGFVEVSAVIVLVLVVLVDIIVVWILIAEILLFIGKREGVSYWGICGRTWVCLHVYLTDSVIR